MTCKCLWPTFSSQAKPVRCTFKSGAVGVITSLRHSAVRSSGATVSLSVGLCDEFEPGALPDQQNWEASIQFYWQLEVGRSLLWDNACRLCEHIWRVINTVLRSITVQFCRAYILSRLVFAENTTLLISVLDSMTLWRIRYLLKDLFWLLLLIIHHPRVRLIFSNYDDFSITN